MLEHIPGLPDLILFWINDVSVIRVSRRGITRGTLSGKHVLTLIWMIMTGDLFKIKSNWAVITDRRCWSPKATYIGPGHGTWKRTHTWRAMKIWSTGVSFVAGGKKTWCTGANFWRAIFGMGGNWWRVIQAQGEEVHACMRRPTEFLSWLQAPRGLTAFPGGGTAQLLGKAKRTPIH